MEQIAAAIDYEMLFMEFESRIHAAQQFENSQAIQRSVKIPNRVIGFYGAFSSGRFALFNGYAGT